MENKQYNVKVGQFYKVVNINGTIDVLYIDKCTYAKGFCDIKEYHTFTYCAFYEKDVTDYLVKRNAELICDVEAYIIMANQRLVENNLYHNMYKDYEHVNSAILCIDGDWKHEHLASKNILEKYFDCEIEYKPNDYPAVDDCFYAEYLIKFKGLN